MGGKRGERGSGFVFESGLGVVLGVVYSNVGRIIHIQDVYRWLNAPPCMKSHDEILYRFLTGSELSAQSRRLECSRCFPGLSAQSLKLERSRFLVAD